MKKYIILFSAYLFLTGCATSISGQLKTIDGKIISNNEGRINISYLNGKGSDEYIGVFALQKDGSFNAKGKFKDGKYLIEALVPGYKTSSVTIDLHGSKNITLSLTPISKPKASLIDANIKVNPEQAGGRATLSLPQL